MPSAVDQTFSELVPIPTWNDQGGPERNPNVAAVSVPGKLNVDSAPIGHLFGEIGIVLQQNAGHVWRDAL